MRNTRNIIMLSLLGLFFAWYGLSWAYRSLYREPRDRLGARLTQYRQGIDQGRRNIALMQQFIGQNQLYYYRSLPRVPNDARSLYSFWFLELLKFCEIEEGDVDSDNPTRTTFGMNYRFHVRGTCTLDRLSRLLFEFYYAPFLHKIVALTIIPLEGRENYVTVTMTVDAAAIRPATPQSPYPPANRLPTGHFRRLRSTDLADYRVIADRNLLQAAKGGVDRADHAFLTAINRIDDRTEIWLSIRTDNSVVRAGPGESVRIGSFRATVAEILEQDVVFERDGMHWLVALGDCLNQAFAIPPESIWPGEGAAEP